jgi:hypothetical protein
MVANAGCCVFYQNRKGKAYIEPWNKQYSGFAIEPRISYAHPEYTLNKPLKSVLVSYDENSKAEVIALPKGEVQTVDNPFIISEEDAVRLGEHVKDMLLNRKVVTGEFRTDLTLDALDCIIVTSKYASNVIGLSNVKYTNSGGAFKGEYTGRVISLELTPIVHHSGEIYVGEV